MLQKRKIIPSIRFFHKGKALLLSGLKKSQVKISVFYEKICNFYQIFIARIICTNKLLFYREALSGGFSVSVPGSLSETGSVSASVVTI